MNEHMETSRIGGRLCSAFVEVVGRMGGSLTSYSNPSDPLSYHGLHKAGGGMKFSCPYPDLYIGKADGVI